MNMNKQYQIEVCTEGRGLINITDDVAKCVAATKGETGLCHVFLHHTSASLILCENHDPLVLKDLESFMQRLIPDGDPLFEHIAEGKDDMPSHVRSILTQNSLTIPITRGKLGLGTWQGIYLWEHRLRGHVRKITLTVQAE
jgi:secondary thiamine-phosphate synthase enzyme